MFKCDNCGTQSQPGESPSIVPTSHRTVMYCSKRYSSIGHEWTGQRQLCNSCINSTPQVPLVPNMVHEVFIED